MQHSHSAVGCVFLGFWAISVVARICASSPWRAAYWSPRGWWLSSRHLPRSNRQFLYAQESHTRDWSGMQFVQGFCFALLFSSRLAASCCCLNSKWSFSLHRFFWESRTIFLWQFPSRTSDYILVVYPDLSGKSRFNKQVDYSRLMACALFASTQLKKTTHEPFQ